ncbi:MAG: hypothetical protein U9R34_05605 [Nanoarchaeota archaeon]|nr:hypothetical protein [Nanoarchaeota archaeon]
MIKKRGSIEIQFNWIFILIAGMIILGFFLSIVNKQKHIAEDQISASIRINLGAVLTGTSAARDTASRINIPNIDIIYDCDGYIIGRADAIRAKTSFAPSLVKGPVIISWTRDWYMPFRVTHFLYITSPFIKYIFVRDTAGVAEYVYNALPNRTIMDKGEVKAFFSKELVDFSKINEIKDQNHYKVRFIFFGDNPKDADIESLFGGLKNKDFTAVKIDANGISDLNGVGKLTFYVKKMGGFKEISGVSESAYIGEASAFGAIFADDPETYNCNMQRAFNTFKLVNTIYFEKVKGLKEDSQTHGDAGCQDPYTHAMGHLEALNTNIPYVKLGYTESGQISSWILTPADLISAENENALYKSCPAIY